MAILVTGGAGYIGSHMAWALLERGQETILVDDLSTGKRRLAPAVCKLIKGDIGNAPFLDQLLSSHAVTEIVHFAASVNVSGSLADPARYYENNSTASRVLFEAAVRHGVRSVVFLSTAAVYAEPRNGLPVCEGSEARPQSPYGRSKLIAERMLEEISREHGLRYVIFRYFNVAGADPHGRTGPVGPGKNTLVKVACEAAAGQRDSVTIYGTDFDTRDGTGVRDYVHVSDIVDAHLLALESLAETRRAGVTLNCGYGRGHSVRDVIRAVQEASGVDFKVVHSGRRAGDVAEVVADASKIRVELGWKPRRDDLQVIVQDALRWERRQLDRAGAAPRSTFQSQLPA